MSRKFQNLYCSVCHCSHAFELVAGLWISRNQCSKVLHDRRIETVREKAIAFLAEHRLSRFEGR